LNIPFSDNCIKGIPNKEFLLADGSVGSHLFYFEESKNRSDGYDEQSINWEDDTSAISFTLNQKTDNGDWQFDSGVALIPRNEIDRLNRQPSVNGILAYERHPLEHNPYHGNILLRVGIPKPTMKKIAAGLALAVSKIIPHQHD
jgi:hypothetical protein